MISYINADVTTVTDCVLAHGVNCQGVMGSGVALAIRNKWPNCYKTYKKYVETNLGKESKELLGECFLHYEEAQRVWIANCFTQDFYGRDGNQYATKNSVFESLFQAYEFAGREGLMLAMPKIASGLGGLDWNDDVYPIVSDLSLRYNTYTLVCIY